MQLCGNKAQHALLSMTGVLFVFTDNAHTFFPPLYQTQLFSMDILLSILQTEISLPYQMDLLKCWITETWFPSKDRLTFPQYRKNNTFKLWFMTNI